MKQRTLKIIVYDTRISSNIYYIVDAICVDGVFALFEKDEFFYIAHGYNGYWQIVMEYPVSCHERIKDAFSSFSKKATIILNRQFDKRYGVNG